MNKKNLIFWFLGFGALLGFGMILIREGFSLISESYAYSSNMDSYLVPELLDDLIAGVLILALTVLFGVFTERKTGRLFFVLALSVVALQDLIVFALDIWKYGAKANYFYVRFGFDIAIAILFLLSAGFFNKTKLWKILGFSGLGMQGINLLIYLILADIYNVGKFGSLSSSATGLVQTQLASGFILGICCVALWILFLVFYREEAVKAETEVPPVNEPTARPLSQGQPHVDGR